PPTRSTVVVEANATVIDPNVPPSLSAAASAKAARKVQVPLPVKQSASSVVVDVSADELTVRVIDADGVVAAPAGAAGPATATTEITDTAVVHASTNDMQKAVRRCRRRQGVIITGSGWARNGGGSGPASTAYGPAGPAGTTAGDPDPGPAASPRRNRMVATATGSPRKRSWPSISPTTAPPLWAISYPTHVNPVTRASPSSTEATIEPATVPHRPRAAAELRRRAARLRRRSPGGTANTLAGITIDHRVANDTAGTSRVRHDGHRPRVVGRHRRTSRTSGVSTRPRIPTTEITGLATTRPPKPATATAAAAMDDNTCRRPVPRDRNTLGRRPARESSATRAVAPIPPKANGAQIAPSTTVATAVTATRPDVVSCPWDSSDGNSLGSCRSTNEPTHMARPSTRPVTSTSRPNRHHDRPYSRTRSRISRRIMPGWRERRGPGPGHRSDQRPAAGTRLTPPRSSALTEH